MGFTFTDLALTSISTPAPDAPPVIDSSDASDADPLPMNLAPDADTAAGHDKKSSKNKPTIFVGNVPLKVTTVKSALKEFLKLFSPFGKILSYRFRSIATDSKYKRAGVLNHKFNQDLKSTVNAYIVFDELDYKVLQLNGLKWEDHHLRIDDTSNPKSLLPLKSVFLGNLPLDVCEEEIWQLFSEIGTITNVRLVRDKTSQIGKGFGFVEFSDKGSVSLALKQNLKIKDRQIRITSMKRNDTPAERRLKKKSNVSKNAGKSKAAGKSKSVRKSAKKKSPKKSLKKK
jgi:nucleolar protein 12